MTNWLCDTNVLSEPLRPAPHPAIVAWLSSLEAIAVSVITVEEVSAGLHHKRASKQIEWFNRFLTSRCQVIVVTWEVARLAGEMRGAFRRNGEQRTQADMLIAATAKLHGVGIATRNVKDFAGCGVELCNPFKE